MIDTIGIFLEHKEAWKTIEPYLTDQVESTTKNTGEVSLTGKTNNFKIYANSEILTLNGSLSRFYFGSNAKTLTRSNIHEAINNLSDSLHFPVQEGILWRLDIAENIIVEKPIVNYLSELIELAYMKRSEVAERQTLYFTNKQKKISFYDKVKELERKNEILPEDFKGNFVLRYENAVIKRLSRQFGRQIKVAELYDPGFLYLGYKQWKEDYFSIKKGKPIGEIIMRDRRTYLKYLAAKGIEGFGGVKTILARIQADKESGKLSKMQCQRLRKLTLDLTTTNKSQETGTEIMELDTKINQAYQKNIQLI